MTPFEQSLSNWSDDALFYTLADIHKHVDLPITKENAPYLQEEVNKAISILREMDKRAELKKQSVSKKDFSTVIDGQPISVTLNTEQDFYPDRDDIDELIIGLGTIHDISSETVSIFIKKDSIIS